MPALKLYWDSVPNAVSYNVYWKTSSGVTINNGNPITNITNVVYHHTGLLENTVYYYIVAAVDAAGNIGPASAEFSAQSSNINGIAIQPTDIILLAGQTQQYTSNLVYSSGGTIDVTADTTWDTSDHSIATITATGLATAIQIGNVNILASYDGYSASIPLAIHHTLLSIVITPSSPTVNVAGTTQLTATGFYNDSTSDDLTDQVIWGSSDVSKATVDAYGVAHGIFHGTTLVSAVLGSVHAANVTLTVNRLISSIVVSPTNPTVAYPNTQQFTAQGTFNDGSSDDVTNSVTWSSGDTSLATIDASTGLMTSIAHGSTTIYATSGIVQGSTGVTITATLVSIAITPLNPTIFFLSDTQQFTATGTYNDSTTSDITTSVTWASSLTSIATIGANTGLASAVAGGSSTISCSLGLVTSNTTPLTVALWAQQTSNVSTDLTGVWGFSATNIYAVGKLGTILHWDGSTWTTLTSGTSANFKGIQGPDPGHIYAWADDNCVYVSHDNGGTWTKKTATNGVNVGYVFANSSTDAWFTAGGSRIIWSGDEFSTVGIDDGNLPGTSGFIGTGPVYGFGVNDMFVGGGGNTSSPIFTYTGGAKRGTSWVVQSYLDSLNPNFGSNSMWGTSHNNLWIAGNFFNGQGVIHTTDNFGSYSLYANTSNTGHTVNGALPADIGTLSGISGSNTNNVIYVSSVGSSTNGQHFNVLAFHNGTWTQDYNTVLSGGPSARAIWTDETTGYTVAVGDQGTILEKGINPVLQSIAVTPTPRTLYFGTDQFVATGRYSNYFFQDVTNSSTWASSDTSAATVNSTGLVTSVGTQSPTLQSVPNVSGFAGGMGLYGNASNNIYAWFPTTGGSPIYHSTGNGTWTQTSSWPGATNDGSIASNLWVDSVGRVYVSYANGNGNGALQISTNGGASWTTATIAGLTNQYVNAFGFDDNHVYAAAGTSLSMNMYFSSDQGATWSALTAISEFVNKVFCVSNTEVYVCTGYGGGGGVWVSTDGINFTKKALASTYGQANVISAWGNSSKVYAGLTGGVIISSKDHGTTWQREGIDTTSTISGIWGTSSTNVWAADANHVWLSIGDGAWRSVNRSTAATTSYVWAPDALNVYVTANGQILKTGHGLSTYITATANSITSNNATVITQPSWQSQTATFLAGDAIGQGSGASDGSVAGMSDTNVVMGGIQSGGGPVIFHWDGAAWTAVIRGAQWPGGATGNPVDHIVVASDKSLYLAHNIRNIIKSTDGINWSAVTDPSAGGFVNAICALDANNFWTYSGVGGVNSFKRSTNGGVSWTTITTPSDSGNVAINSFFAFNANDIWAVGNHGGVGVVWKWNGTIWSQVSPWTAISGSGQAPMTNIHNIWGTSDNDLYISGDTSFVSTPNYSPIVHSTNQFSSWTAQAIGSFGTGGIQFGGSAWVSGSTTYNVLYATIAPSGGANFYVYYYRPGISAANTWVSAGAVNTGNFAEGLYINDSTGRVVAAGGQSVQTNNSPY